METVKEKSCKQKHIKKAHPRRRVVLTILAFGLLVFLGMSLIWAESNFGNIGVEEILFTLNMPLDGSGSDFVGNFIVTVLLSCVLLLAVVLGGCKIFWMLQDRKKANQPQQEPQPARKPVSAKILVICWLAGFAVLLVGANHYFGVADFIKAQFNQSYLIEEEYVDPNSVSIQFPEKKRNLIWILMESGETSAQDKANGGLFDENYIPELTQIAKENVSFSHSDKLEGAAVAPACGWTVAGMVAQSSGMPLKLYKYDDGGVDNGLGQYKDFLPGVTNLGDILEKEGYHNFFLLGSDAAFGGRDKLMKQHGNFEIYDLNTAREKGKIPQDYFVWWGYEDQKLFEYAKEELTQLSQQDEPFNFLCLTVDTHHVGGYLCPLCRNDFDEQYANVWACSSRQVSEFVEWCKQQPFYENTTIIITGDHCSMDPDFYSDFPYDKHRGETVRKVYNAIINAPIQPVQETGRKFTTLDMFPTALAAIGAEIEGDRLGIGTNLFSDRETLAEEYGYEKLFDELNRKSAFYNEELLYQQ